MSVSASPPAAYHTIPSVDWAQHLCAHGLLLRANVGTLGAFESVTLPGDSPAMHVCICVSVRGRAHVLNSAILFCPHLTGAHDVEHW